MINPKVATTWLSAKEIIRDFLKDLRPDLSYAAHDHNAGALIARLAHAQPPLLICTPDEMKEE